MNARKSRTRLDCLPEKEAQRPLASPRSCALSDNTQRGSREAQPHPFSPSSQFVDALRARAAASCSGSASVVAPSFTFALMRLTLATSEIRRAAAPQSSLRVLVASSRALRRSQPKGAQAAASSTSVESSLPS